MDYSSEVQYALISKNTQNGSVSTQICGSARMVERVANGLRSLAGGNPPIEMRVLALPDGMRDREALKWAEVRFDEAVPIAAV